MYLLIENFNNGMDSRRMALTSKPGTLQSLINCHITRGGEIEKRKAFVPIATVSSNTFGVHSANGQLVTFGSVAPGSVTITQGGFGPPDPPDPSFVVPNIIYQQLNNGGVSSQISFPELSGSLVPYSVVVKPSYRLLISLVGIGNSSSAALTFTGTTKPADGTYLLTVVDANNAYIDTGALNCSNDVVATMSALVITDYAYDLAGRVIYASDGNPAYYTTTVYTASTAAVSSLSSASAIIAFPGGSSLPSNVVIRFPEAPNATGTYTRLTTTTGSFTVGGKNITTAITKCYVNPGVSAITVGATNILPNGVPWATSLLGATDERNQTVNAIVSAINLGTGTHNVTAYAQSGTIILTSSSASPGTTLTVSAWSVTAVVSGAFASNGTSMTKLVNAENYGGQIYSVAEFDSSILAHFFNGFKVKSWDIISNSGSNTTTATQIAKKLNSGGNFTSTSSSNAVTVTFVRKNVTHTVTATTVNGGGVDNQTITVTTTAATTVSPQITTLTIGGTYEPTDIFKITIDGVLYTIEAQEASVGTFCKTYNNKMYSIANSLLFFSETDTNGGPTAFTNDTTAGAGVINLSNQDAGSDSLTSLAIYQGNLAMFSKTAVQIWTMNADPKLNAKTQILNNIGTFAPRSTVSIGNIDTYFLSSSGIRSLRARDASNVAVVSDIGAALDDIVLADLKKLTDEEKNGAIGILDPVENRYWLCVKNRVYIYSNYTTANISAWSIYEPTDSSTGLPIVITDITILNSRIYCRAGNTIYAYGGLNGGIYDASVAEVLMPYLDGGKPAHLKTMKAIDSACVGTWSVYNGMDITYPDARDYIGDIENSTYSYGSILAPGIGTHIGIRMTNQTAEYAKIGNFACHFEINDAS
jgi:hypothetical protein